MPSSPDHYSIAPEDYRPKQIIMPTAEEFAVMEQARLAEDEIRQEAMKKGMDAYNRRKWKSRMKKVMAATALLATVKSGGFADMAADPFNDAGEIAAAAIDVAPVSIPDQLDGIAYEDFSKQAQRDITREENDRFEQDTTAKNSVVSLFERADKEGYNGIVAEVNAEKREHPELFLSSESIETALTRIEASETNEQALQVLNEFMREYGMSADFYGGKAFEDRQDQFATAAKAYVNVFSKLPKDLIAMANLQSLTISSEGILDEQEHVGIEGGAYTGESINITALPGVLDAIEPLESRLQFDDMGYESLVAHELGHALSYNLRVFSSLDVDEVVTEGNELKELDFIARGTGIARGAIDYPEHVSTYGRYSTGENTAEVLSGILSDRRNGLASVEETRAFTSPANESMIDMLAQLEAVRPGIAKILIANRVS